MSDPTQIIIIDSSPIGLHFRAHLIYNPEERIGKGSFKTANQASLEFGNVRPLVGLGSHIDTSKLTVALKRPFIDKAASKRPGLRSLNATAPVSRLTVTDEQHAVTGEAKLLVWANALLEFAYDFIFDYAQTNNAPPGVEDFMTIIPLFRFVDAGVAVVVKPLETTLTGRPSTQRATYLLEEMLPGTPAEFVKYMHNSEATTILQHDDPEYELAEFLMFMQHVQYQITHGTAYISDFQGRPRKFLRYLISYIFQYIPGVGTSLTDPQIMTKPDLGSSLFGDGNLGEAFSKFPIEHACIGNRWCEWFELGKLQADNETDDAKGHSPLE